MNVEVIPSINVQTFDEVKDRIRKVEPYVKWCHLDVTDGIFSSHETWRNPNDLENLKTSLNVEVHLMIKNIDEAIDDWLRGPVKRVVIHAEAVKNFDLIREKCLDRGIELGIAVNPETSADTFLPYIGKADTYLCLAVDPGPSGQKMNKNTLGKIGSLRKSCPNCIIEVDGGVHPETVRGVVHAGANVLVAGNYIFSSPSIESAIESLEV